MVFEARAGETFLLGASTWRIDQITHDRVLVSPAPGEPGKMPFWKGEGAGPPGRARHGDRQAGARAAQGRSPRRPSRALEQRSRTRSRRRPRTCSRISTISTPPPAPCPTIARIVIERSRDDLGDWRVAVLSPLGSRVHAPWAMAATARIRDEAGRRRRGDVVRRWVRGAGIRTASARRTPRCCCPIPMRSSGWSCGSSGSTAMFAARFREAAGRALLLPRRRAGAARAAVAAAQARLGSARGGGAIRIVPDHSRDLSRVPARHFRSAGAHRHPARAVAAARCASISVESQNAVAVLGVAAVRLRRQLHLRRRRAAGRTARSGAVGRSIAAARSDRRHRAARSARRSASLDTLEQELQYLPERFHAQVDRCRPRSAAAARRSVARRRSRRAAIAGVARAAIDELVKTAPRASTCRIAGEERDHRGRGRRAVSRRDRRAAAARPARRAARAGGRSASAISCGASRARTGRSRGKDVARALRPRRGGRRRGAAAAGRRPAASSTASSGRADAAREWCDADVLRTIRQRSLAQLAAGGRAGRCRGARPFPRRLACAGAAASTGSTACSTSIEQLQGVPHRRIGARTRDPARAHPRLLARRCSTRCWRRRGDVDRRRAARRT